MNFLSRIYCSKTDYSFYEFRMSLRRLPLDLQRRFFRRGSLTQYRPHDTQNWEPDRHDNFGRKPTKCYIRLEHHWRRFRNSHADLFGTSA
jgi:hypothetical protein